MTPEEIKRASFDVVNCDDNPEDRAEIQQEAARKKIEDLIICGAACFVAGFFFACFCLNY